MDAFVAGRIPLYLPVSAGRGPALISPRRTGAAHDDAILPPPAPDHGRPLPGRPGRSGCRRPGPPGRPAGAEVRIDGRSQGFLPLAPLTLPTGMHEVECRARGHEPLTQTILVPEGDALVYVRLRPLALRRSRALTGSLLYAGVGQWYMGARWRGWAYFTGETVGLLTALTGELGRITKKDDYTNAQRTYEQAVEPEQIAYWRNQANLTYQDVADMQDLRDSGLLIAAGSWVLSLLDAWLLFPQVDVGLGPVPPTMQAGLDPATAARGVHAAVTVAF
ncbi:MAG: PEGA domain-containing protein [Candidatus Krumholzibacteriia bacterium]